VRRREESDLKLNDGIFPEDENAVAFLFFLVLLGYSFFYSVVINW